MAETASAQDVSALFREGYVEADGFRIRYLEAGEGDALVVLHGAGGLRLYTSHALLAEKRRVILFEAPGFGQSPANDRSRTMAELADTLAQAVANLAIDEFDLQGSSFGGKLALWLAIQHPERVRALVLVSPAAIGRESPRLPALAQAGQRLFAHPERQVQPPPPDSEVREKQSALTRRLLGPLRDTEIESRMSEATMPVLAVFGTLDTITPPELGRFYKELLPNCNLVFVYDAAHAVEADRPEAFVSLVEDFLERHEAFIVSTKSGLINR